MHNLFKLSIILLAFMISNTASAFSRNHFAIMAGVYTRGTSKEDSDRDYKEVKRISRAVSFLDCPITLIEKQYNGIESVLEGTRILSKYFDTSFKGPKDFEDLRVECETLLDYYQEKNIDEEITRAVSDEEMQLLASQAAQATQSAQTLSKEQMGIMGLVMASINQDTVCYTTRGALELAYYFGGSLGIIKAECFTPMGRHFLLKGLSVGYGVGAMAAVTWPNIPGIPSAPNWSFKLYDQKYANGYIHERHDSFHASLGIGASIESKNRRTNSTNPMRYRNDIKAVSGWGVMAEITHNYLFKTKRLSPLYFGFSQVLDLNILLTKNF